ncbi:hypothetical protein HK100_000850 [Physocladia obscura]|uniref:Uncharacterized protein n=1 Tax=Physocladia obscura TaxID=109957 RepID=A0AAD5XCA2_9FUNG|nr:hypothetical protein HK100_000850 [Physocladia obscura]
MQSIGRNALDFATIQSSISGILQVKGLPFLTAGRGANSLKWDNSENLSGHGQHGCTKHVDTNRYPNNQQPPPVTTKKSRLSHAITQPVVSPATSSVRAKQQQKTISDFFARPPRHTPQTRFQSNPSVTRAPLAVKFNTNINLASTSKPRVLPSSFTSIPPKAPRVSPPFTVLRDSSNSAHVTATKANIPILVNDSDEDFEHAALIANSRIHQPNHISVSHVTVPDTAMKRRREQTSSDEESDEGVKTPPDEYLCVKLTDFGIKNWAKLFNRRKNRIVEPPKKKCKKCDELMDWRTKGCIALTDGKYYYANYCAGECIKSVNEPESIDDCVDKFAGIARAGDLANGFEVNCSPEESRKIFRDAWARHNRKCTCCKVDLQAFGNGAAQISKQRNKPGLSYHDPNQDLDFLCVPCNRLRDIFSAREVQDVFKKIHEAAQKPAVHRQPTPTEITRIKAMRKDNYAKEDREIVKTVKRNNWSVSPTAKSTATSDDLIAIAKKAGCIGMHSGIEGKFTVGKDIFKLGFDRKISTTFDVDGKKIKWLHSRGNLQLELSCINAARNSLSVDEFSVWIDRIKQGLFR